ncbi:hypothetical protein Hanom_Chr05g00446741 [Helianthus anomalus]
MSHPRGGFRMWYFGGVTSLAEAEAKLSDLRKIVAAKDKKMAQLEKEKTGLDEQLMFVKIGIHEAQVNATESAKVYVAQTVLLARKKMVEEAMDPSFDRSSWNVDGWKLALKNLGAEAEEEQVLSLEAGTSGVKKPKDGARDNAAGGDDAAGGGAG